MTRLIKRIISNSQIHNIKYHCAWLVIWLCFPLNFSTVCAMQYKLSKVTRVESGGMYVFEQDGYVMSNSIAANALQTTDNYRDSSLSGNEPYVWTLEPATGGVYMKNLSLTSRNYLSSTKRSTNVSLGTKSNQGVWQLTFDADGFVLIQAVNNDLRYLGFVDGKTVYKAYSTSDMSYAHRISVYQLVEDDGSGIEKLGTPQFSPAAGRVEEGTVVTITSAATGLRYTTDTSDPRSSETATIVHAKQADITILQTTTIKAVSTDTDGNMSDVVHAQYTVVDATSSIDLRGTDQPLLFSDFTTLGSWYSDEVESIPLTASNDRDYTWAVSNAQYDAAEHSAILRGGKGTMQSPTIKTDEGFCVKLHFLPASSATIQLSVTGTAPVTTTATAHDTPAVVEASTTNVAATINIASVSNSLSIESIEIIPASSSDKTKIEEIKPENGTIEDHDAVYDLQGRRVADTIQLHRSSSGIILNRQLPKGLYIVDGQKIYIK